MSDNVSNKIASNREYLWEIKNKKKKIVPMLPNNYMQFNFVALWSNFLSLLYFYCVIMQAQKAEREATDLKGTMRKRMEFLDLD